MIRSLWTGASGMTGQQFHIDTISHNLANVNTIGYKKERADFEDLLWVVCGDEGAGRDGGDLAVRRSGRGAGTSANDRTTGAGLRAKRGGQNDDRQQGSEAVS